MTDGENSSLRESKRCQRVTVRPNLVVLLGDRHGFRDDARYAAALVKLIAGLRQPNPKLGALFAVPNLPPNFLGRPELMRRVRDALLVDLQKPQVSDPLTIQSPSGE